MKLADIHVGDRLRFREARDIRNDPQGGYSFTLEMNYLCGKEFTVERIVGNRIFSEEEVEYSERYGFKFSISAQMLEPVLKPLQSRRPNLTKVLFGE